MQVSDKAMQKGKQAALAQKALQDANFVKQQEQVDARIAEVEAKIIELNNA